MDIDLRAAYRRCFFSEDNPYGMIVFADMIERSGWTEDLFANGDRPGPKTDNAYLLGRESFFLEILDIMGITGAGQHKRIAEAISNVLPIEIEEQKKGETEDV